MRIIFPFNKDLEKIFQLLNYNCKLVGGCVRDFILFNTLVDDIDIATPFLPFEVNDLLKSHFSIIPTGLKHGTVTIVGEKKYEITTLRKDVETDGRHALVSFSGTTYEEDAARRDFTMNAFYCDYSGEIFDYFDGLKDLDHGIVKFIGDPEMRIKEDFLRILRFFRFAVRFRNADSFGLAACLKLKEGLLTISKERITQEWFKIINGKYFSEFFKDFLPIMDILNLKSSRKIDLIDIFNLSDLAFTSLFLNEKSLICLSNSQKKYINLLKGVSLKNQTDANIIFNKFGEKLLNDKMILENVFFEKIKIDCVPISGQDLIDFGYMGKQIGDALKQIEFFWYQNFGKLSKTELLNFYKDNYAK
ncbi:hypothetical protein [Alphaproteobacteria bacterium endosymbiont of Tiliacea citrago]|uniref:hypothetical protein n=1 Tax=Alphaproteobacteria bacterium endosymbiont of Tiliacea citrago TaxID=3077944 RepID=UPI00313C79A6